MSVGEFLASQIPSKSMETGEILQHPGSTESHLRAAVRKAVCGYLEALDGQLGSGIYQMVLTEIEAPMLEEILAYTRHNQSQAARMLGLNRGTLRKKLKQHGLLEESDY